MDPLSITASIVAVLQATNKAVKYLLDVRNAPKECQSCTTETLNLLPLLHSLKGRAEQAQDGDPWTEQLRRLNGRDGPLDQYKHAIDLLLSRVDAGQGTTKVKKRLVWKFSKGEVKSIQSTLERLKSLVSMALSMDHVLLSEAIKADTSFARASLRHMQADVSTLQITADSVQTDTQNIRGTADSVKDDTKNIRAVQARNQHRSVLEWLSSTDYPAQQHDILVRRQDGTAQWFLDSTEFRQWLHGPEKTLFCPGIPGAGKTMMAAIAVEHLFRTSDTATVGIACVFCSYKAQVDQSVPSLLAAILKQLAPRSADATTRLTDLYEKCTQRGVRPALNELLEAILVCVSRSTTYVVVDALDECSSQDGARDRFVEVLRSLQASGNVRLLFTSRFIPEVTDKFYSDLQLEVRASEEDVRRFLDGQISALPRCVQRDEALQRDVQNTIVKAVDGMFLLAVLHFQSICEQTNRKEVRATLAELASGFGALDAAYQGALTRIDGQPPRRRDLAQRALCWISYARRPLTAQELQTALAIEPDETALDLDNLHDVDDIVSFCAGLVTVDHGSDVVRLVHYTTQEYLQQVRSAWVPDMQHTIAEACLTYLSFEVFRNGRCDSDAALEARLRQHQFVDYTASFWGEHVRPVEQAVIQSVMKILDEDALRESITQIVFTSNFQYSSSYPRGFTALHMVARNGLLHLVQQYLGRQADGTENNVNAMDSHSRTPLSYASEKGHERVVKLLLDRGADVNAQGGEYGTSLCAASAGGHEQIVKLLLDVGADVNAERGAYHTALIAASTEGHEQVVKLLLDAGADVNAEGGVYHTALIAASVREHEQVVELLLDKNADVNVQREFYTTALCAASARGNKRIVKLLLDRGSDVNVEGGQYGTALIAASAAGYEQIVKLLLDVGADVNAQGGEYGTALIAASAGGYNQVVELLLDTDADVDVQNGHRIIATHAASALYAASGRGYVQIVKLLLDKGANVNAEGGDYDTALCAASAGGYVQVVKLLLDNGADVNAEGGEYDTALCAASAGGHEEVVELLIDRGADVNEYDESFMSALHHAQQGGHEQIFELLLERSDPWTRNESVGSQSVIV